MIRHLVILALASSLSAVGVGVWAQQTKAVFTVGLLTTAARPQDAGVEAFRQGMRELGYVEGRNTKIEFRTAEGHVDRLPALAEDLVRLNPDAIVVSSTEAAYAVKHISSTIPIVLAIAHDPVASGLVTNLAHPGGNITGLSSMSAELVGKRLELLKEAAPKISRVAVLWNPDIPLHLKMTGQLKAAAPSLLVKLDFVGVRTPEEFGSSILSDQASQGSSAIATRQRTILDSSCNSR